MSIQSLFARLAGRVLIRGTITTPTGEETFPVAVSNEIMGGPFIVDTLDELKEIPFQRLVKGCKCTVNEHVGPDGSQKTTTYILKAVPSQKLSEMSEVNISDYWILDRPQQQEESAVESQYAPHYLGKKPPFLTSEISKDAYNAGYATTDDYEAADTSKKIWVSDFDNTIHKWVRQRTGTLADWGIPVLVDEGYQEGAYNDVRFQWRDKLLGKPTRPSSMVDGNSNKEPAGWEDTPEPPEGTDYDTMIVTHDLWKISATRGVYGELLSEWTDPVKISTDPQLVRYGVDANNNDYLDDDYWRAYYSPGDRFKASRETLALPWVVERITGESGEYTDYVFKEFEDSYEPLPSDAPTSILGYGINGWNDGVFETQEGYTLYVSTSRKYSDNTQATPWTTPVRYDGKNTIRAVVVPKGDVGHTFKYKYVGGALTTTPESITLEAKLFDANNQIDASKITRVDWYRGTVETGTIVPKLPIGTAPNRNPQYGGTRDTELTVFPENVTGTQEFTARVWFNQEDYIDPIDVIDTTDGVGYQALIDSTTGFIYKGSETKTFTAYLYENGIDVSAAQGITYSWDLGGSTIGTDRSVDITDTDVTGVTKLTLTISLGDNQYHRVETLTDVADGKSSERQYSSLENMNITYTPDTPDNPGAFSTSSLDAVWAIDRLEGEPWGTVYRIKGEKGDPNGAFQKTVYRTRAAGETPSWLAVKPTAITDPGETLIPLGWSENPESSAPTGSEIYGTKATFLKNPSTDETAEFVANWTITGTGWSLPFKVTTFPEAGSNGEPGTDGHDGWSPVIVVVSDGDRRVHQLKEWVGGTGAKPAGEGFYLGPGGLVSVIGDATDIRGSIGLTGAKGDDGVFNASDFWDGDTYIIQGSNGSPNYESWEFRFRKAKNGIVHYAARWYRNAGGYRTVDFNLNSTYISEMLPISLAAGVSFETVLGFHGVKFEDGTRPGITDDGSASSVRIVNFGDGVYKLQVEFSGGWTGTVSGSYPTSEAFSM